MSDFYAANSTAGERHRVNAVARGDGLIDLRRGGDSFVAWNHDVHELASALDRPNAVAEWMPERHLLIVRWDAVIELGTIDPESADGTSMPGRDEQSSGIFAGTAQKHDHLTGKPERLTDIWTVFSVEVVDDAYVSYFQPVGPKPMTSHSWEATDTRCKSCCDDQYTRVHFSDRWSTTPEQVESCCRNFPDCPDSRSVLEPSYCAAEDLYKPYLAGHPMWLRVDGDTHDPSTWHRIQTIRNTPVKTASAPDGSRINEMTFIFTYEDGSGPAIIEKAAQVEFTIPRVYYLRS